MTDKPDLEPIILARPDSKFRFPPRYTLSNDIRTSELRLVIIGWLRHAQDVITNDRGLQELRDSLFRAAELTVTLSAMEITKAQANAKETSKTKSVIHRERGKADARPDRKKQKVQKSEAL